MRAAITGCFLLAAVLGAPYPVHAQNTGGDHGSSWFVWSPDRFFGPCDGDCGVAFYGGREVMTNMTSVFLVREPTAPWNVQTGDAGVIASALSRNFATLFGFIGLGAEAGLDQRFGSMHATTAWLALDVRLIHFPWDNVVVTTVGFAVGPDVASQIDTQERISSGNGVGSHLLNFASPEITLALPGHPGDELVLRYQHRSGVAGLINGVTDGSSFACIGLRHLF